MVAIECPIASTTTEVRNPSGSTEAISWPLTHPGRPSGPTPWRPCGDLLAGGIVHDRACGTESLHHRKGAVRSYLRVGRDRFGRLCRRNDCFVGAPTWLEAIKSKEHGDPQNASAINYRPVTEPSALTNIVLCCHLILSLRSESIEAVVHFELVCVFGMNRNANWVGSEL